MGRRALGFGIAMMVSLVLIRRWHQIVEENELPIRTETTVSELRKTGRFFTATLGEETVRARRVVVAVGQRGNPRQLGVHGTRFTASRWAREASSGLSEDGATRR
jgi:predicted flavoprotein YhiN